MGSGHTFKRDDGQEYRTDRDFWVGTLLLASRYGWQPVKRRMHYLASDVTVCDEDARRMREALDQLFELALSEPEKVFPVPVDMGELFQLKEFIAEGGFAIC